MVALYFTFKLLGGLLFVALSIAAVVIGVTVIVFLTFCAAIVHLVLWLMRAFGIDWRPA